MADNNNAKPDIWANRIQRELLALTTDNAEAVHAEVPHVLPPFCQVKHHTLNLEQGTALVSVQVEVQTSSSMMEKSMATVVVCLDASLPKLRNGNFDATATAYPFCPPRVMLESGQSALPKGSTIQQGDDIAMDLDWTPSLHLVDAVLNVGLKIKESVLQQEPLHPAPPTTSAAVAAAAATKISSPLDPAVDEVTKGARRLAVSIGSAGKSLTKAFTPRHGAKGKSTPRNASANSSRNNVTPRSQPPSPSVAAAQQQTVRIGDDINLLEEPWVDSHGVYSCKALRRPQFLQDTISRAADHDDQAAFSSPTAMLRSFAQSARGVLEESFLMITDTHIIEMRASKLNMSVGKVTLAVPIDLMAKLKFRRQESLSLFFKPAPDDPLIYMCPDSGDAVHQIQSVLKTHGVRGKHTNAAAHRAINDALQLVQEIQTKELALKHDPTTQRVNEIMDLYRQAAERFEVAGDVRHAEVVLHMRKFLALPLTASILDGSFVRREPERRPSPRSHDGVPEGEVLERSEALINDDDHDGRSSKDKENDKAFEENIDNLLKEAQKDVKELQRGDDSTASLSTDDAALAGVAADLDAMMREADKELAALMQS